MKKITAIAAAMLLTITSFAQDGKSIYQKYSDCDNVSAVYISPSMFRMMGRIPDMDIEGSSVNLGSVIKSLSGFYLISSENAIVNSALKSEADKFISKGKYDMLMEVKDDGETVRIYTMGDEKTVTGFVMLASEPDECTFIFIDGQMPREALEALMAENLELDS